MSSIERILELHTAQDAQNFDELKLEIKEMRKEIAELKELVGRYKGFLGGMVFVISAIAGAVALAISWLR